MSLKVTIDTASELRRQFVDYNRDYYSHAAYEALIEFYEDYDAQLDVICICCEWNENHIDTIVDEYSIDLADITDEDGDIDDNEKLALVMEYLNKNTYAIDLDGSILYQCF